MRSSKMNNAFSNSLPRRLKKQSLLAATAILTLALVLQTWSSLFVSHSCKLNRQWNLWGKNISFFEPLSEKINLSRQDDCLLDDFTVWWDWKVCKEEFLVASKWRSDPQYLNKIVSLQNITFLAKNTTAFDRFIIQNYEQLPWSVDSNYTAVMMEVRTLERQMSYSINNMMNNLPVHWRVQIMAGGRAMCDMMRKLFPVEIAAGKILLTNIQREDMGWVSRIVLT